MKNPVVTSTSNVLEHNNVSSMSYKQLVANINESIASCFKDEPPSNSEINRQSIENQMKNYLSFLEQQGSIYDTYEVNTYKDEITNTLMVNLKYIPVQPSSFNVTFTYDYDRGKSMQKIDALTYAINEMNINDLKMQLAEQNLTYTLTPIDDYASSYLETDGSFNYHLKFNTELDTAVFLFYIGRYYKIK